MNVKMCLIVLLCLLSISMVYCVAATTLNAPGLGSHGSNNGSKGAIYLTVSDNDTDISEGKVKGGGGWP